MVRAEHRDVDDLLAGAVAQHRDRPHEYQFDGASLRRRAMENAVMLP
ncbi:hypothetical protein BVI1335_3330002 [Burkholderia vietnamiensis]|nr:hypothetical protein BVI1335_3330002 [Burkholderia vietnamiensis]